MVSLLLMRLGDRRATERGRSGAARGLATGRKRYVNARWQAQWLSACCVSVLGQAAQTPPERLEPVQLVKILGALILLTFGGISVVVLAWLTLRVGRRRLRQEDATAERLRQRTFEDDWATKPLTQPEDFGRDTNLE